MDWHTLFYISSALSATYLLYDTYKFNKKQSETNIREPDNVYENTKRQIMTYEQFESKPIKGY